VVKTLLGQEFSHAPQPSGQDATNIALVIEKRFKIRLSLCASDLFWRQHRTS
jgi:hypothetical protein